MACQEMDRELTDARQRRDAETEMAGNTIDTLQGRLTSLKDELLSLEGDKENMLSEVISLCPVQCSAWNFENYRMKKPLE